MCLAAFMLLLSSCDQSEILELGTGTYLGAFLGELNMWRCKTQTERHCAGEMRISYVAEGLCVTKWTNVCTRLTSVHEGCHAQTMRLQSEDQIVTLTFIYSKKQ